MWVRFKYLVLIDDLKTNLRVMDFLRTVLANDFSGFKICYVQCGYALKLLVVSIDNLRPSRMSTLSEWFWSIYQDLEYAIVQCGYASKTSSFD